MAQPPRKMAWLSRVPHGLSASQFGAALGFSGRVADYVTARVLYANTELAFTGNAYTQHGVATEPKSRALYEMLTGCVVHDGGFYVTDDELLACTPDGCVYVSDDSDRDAGEQEASDDVHGSSSSSSTTTTTTTTTASSSNDSSASSASLLTWSGALDAQRLRVVDGVRPAVTHRCGVVPFTRTRVTCGSHSNSSMCSSSSGSSSSATSAAAAAATATTTTHTCTRHRRVRDRRRRTRRRRLLEIKSPCHALYMTGKAYSEPFGIPLTYMCQIQGQMAIADADECDFFVYLDGARQCHVEAWRVRRSHAFWAWAEPKLRQVCAWMRDMAAAAAASLSTTTSDDTAATSTTTTTTAAATAAAAAAASGAAAACTRAFVFAPFDFTTIDVAPLVYPFDLGACTPLTDAHRFAFFVHGGLRTTSSHSDYKNEDSGSSGSSMCDSNSSDSRDHTTRRGTYTSPYTRVHGFAPPVDGDDDVLTAIAKMTYSPVVRFLFGPRDTYTTASPTTTTAAAAAADTTSAMTTSANNDEQPQPQPQQQAADASGVLCSSFVSSLDEVSLRRLAAADEDNEDDDDEDEEAQAARRSRACADASTHTPQQPPQPGALPRRSRVYVTLLRNEQWHTGTVQALMHTHVDDAHVCNAAHAHARHKTLQRTSTLQTSRVCVRAHCRAFFASLSPLREHDMVTSCHDSSSRSRIYDDHSDARHHVAMQTHHMTAAAAATPPHRRPHSVQRLHDATIRIALVPEKARRAEACAAHELDDCGDDDDDVTTATTATMAAMTTTTTDVVAAAAATCTPRPRRRPSSLRPRTQQPPSQSSHVVALVPHEKSTSLTQCIRLSLTPQRPTRPRDEVDVDEDEDEQNDGDVTTRTQQQQQECTDNNNGTKHATITTGTVLRTPRTSRSNNDDTTTTAVYADDDDVDVLVEPVVQLIEHDDLLELIDAATDCREVVVLHAMSRQVDRYPRRVSATKTRSLSPLPRTRADDSYDDDDHVDVTQADCQFVLLVGPGAVVEEVVRCAAQLQQQRRQQGWSAAGKSCAHDDHDDVDVVAGACHDSVRALVQRLASSSSSTRRRRQSQLQQQPHDDNSGDDGRCSFVLCYVEEPRHMMSAAANVTGNDDNNVAEYRDALRTPCFVVRDMTWPALLTRIERTLHVRT